MLHRKKGDVNEEIRASRECLVQMAYLDNKDHGKVIDERRRGGATAWKAEGIDRFGGEVQPG